MKRLASFTAHFALAAGTLAAQDMPIPGEQFMLQWDLDGNGQVTRAEAREQRQNIFYMFDQDSDGMFSEEELAGIDEHKALEREAGKGPGSQRPEGMGQGMGSGQGQGMGQGKGMGKGMGQGKGGGMGQGMGAGRGGAAFGFDMPAGEGMRMFDADRNGTITEQEFVDGSDLWFGQRDRNGDGVLTIEDFGPGR